MDCRGQKIITVARLVGLLAVFQVARWGLESLAFMGVSHSLLSNEVVRTAAYGVLTLALLGWARYQRAVLPVLPRAGTRVGYGVALLGFVGLFGATPLLTHQAASSAVWAALVCGALATPLFEELLFRGYVWDRLTRVFSQDWQVIVVSAMLFGLWHLGYLDAVAWRMAQPDALATTAEVAITMGGKVLFATGIGVVLGYLRQRSGGCLAPMLFHGYWNLLA